MATMMFILVIWTVCVGVCTSISPDEVKNRASDEIYHDVLIEPIINNFRIFVNKKRNRNYGYIPNDVFLAQSIETMQHAMFQLGAFYSIQKSHNGLPITLFEKGFALQFESILCDNVYSGKFPRKKPTKAPWKFFTDSAYFKVNCDLPQKIKVPIVSRKRRAINTNTNSACGKIYQFDQNFGNLTFPVDGSEKYMTNIECQWTIEVSATFGVEIRSDFILLEMSDPKCFYDSITFYEGDDDKGMVLDRTCGNQTNYRVRSNGNKITIKFKADESNWKESKGAEDWGRGFVLNWGIIDEIKEHPGYVMTSMIVIDQHGDLNVDTYDFQKMEPGQRFIPKVISDFKLLVEEPQTCPAKSNDPDCQFHQKPYLISKIIATGVSPDFQFQEDAITVVFEHAIQQDLYPDLYESPKYCVTWDPTVLHTTYGSWSRRNGKTLYTNRAKTTCVFSETGVHAVIAMAPPPVDPEPFRFTRSWYCGHLFAVIWITITFIKLSSGAVNIPVWLNMNQLLAVLVYCGICLCGVHTEWHHSACSFLTFALYFFGLSVFVWHLLKAAQFTGAFDKFFKQDRNLYAFYMLLGWGTPFFVVGIAGGVQLVFDEGKLSCWMAIKGGPIWGYGAPVYFIILSILYLYYKGVKKNIARMMKYNYTKMVRRTMRDSVQLLLFIITWATGVLAFHREDVFLHQYLFCIFLSLTVVSLCLFARQARRSFEKIYDKEDLYDVGTDYFDKKDPLFYNEPDLIYRIWLAKTYFAKWKKQKEPEPLKLALKLPQFEGAKVHYKSDKCDIHLQEEQKYTDPSYFLGAVQPEYNYDNDDIVEEDMVEEDIVDIDDVQSDHDGSGEEHDSSHSSSTDSGEETKNLRKRKKKKKGRKEVDETENQPLLLPDDEDPVEDIDSMNKSDEDSDDEHSNEEADVANDDIGEEPNVTEEEKPGKDTNEESSSMEKANPGDNANEEDKDERISDDNAKDSSANDADEEASDGDDKKEGNDKTEDKSSADENASDNDSILTGYEGN